MLRIDRSITPTMAKALTLGTWERERLGTIDHVVRRGRITTVNRRRIDLAHGSVAVADDALVVSCAADGLKKPPRVPLWWLEAITLQPIRAGFPCSGRRSSGTSRRRARTMERRTGCARRPRTATLRMTGRG